MNFKRKGPKATRAGCLMCKPWKAMGNARLATPPNALRKMQKSEAD